MKAQFQQIGVFQTFCLDCKLFMSDLYIFLDIFKYADSAYITRYLVLSYIEKLILNGSYFLATFRWLINFIS